MGVIVVCEQGSEFRSYRHRGDATEVETLCLHWFVYYAPRNAGYARKRGYSLAFSKLVLVLSFLMCSHPPVKKKK